MKKKSKITYKQSGVDIVKADRLVEKIKALVAPTLNSNVISHVGGFAALYKINDKQYLAASTDGVGTKLKVAQQLGIHSSIGQDLVAMCVNDLICTGARPLFFLDYFATGGLDLKTSYSVLKGISEACLESGIALIGGETAEMPGVYEKGVYDLAGFSVGLVDKKNLINGSKIKKNDVLIGLPSSGFHSNGYSLLRKLIKPNQKQLLKKILTPTRLYVKPIMKAIDNGFQIKAMAHITGSGFLNIPRINEKFDYQIRDDLKVPPIFREIQKLAQIDDFEMARTFNMGVGFVIATSPENSKALIRFLDQNNQSPFVLGQVLGQGSGQVVWQGHRL